jgi:hypothetical protein
MNEIIEKKNQSIQIELSIIQQLKKNIILLVNITQYKM